MDRGVWASAVIGFLAPVAMFSPLNRSEAWFSAWQKPAKPAAVAGLAPAGPSRLQAPRTEKIVRVRAERAIDRHGFRGHAAGRAAPGRVEKSVVGKAPPAPAPQALDPKEQLARTIDPGKRPDWYLIDPTLKRGDVLFLQDKVVVFRGRKIGSLSDYVPVSRTRMLSRKERRLIEKLAGPAIGRAPAPSMAEARPDKVADVSSAGLPAAN